jgi:seryl-tRNA synthetase
MPIDINQLREYKGGNPAKWREYMEKRFKPASWVDEVIAKDEEWRVEQKKLDSLRKEVNTLQKEVIAPKKKAKEPCDDEVFQMKEMQAQINGMKKSVPEIAKERDSLLNRIGNIVDPDVPTSHDEDNDNVVVALYPKPVEEENSEGKALLPSPLGQLTYTLPATKKFTHDDLLWRIDGYEPIRGQNVAGHRAYFLKNAGVLLNQALINYAIAFLRKREYDILQPPYMMNKEVMSTLAQLEDFDEQLYKVSGRTDDPKVSSDKYLIATSEQPICGYYK